MYKAFIQSSSTRLFIFAMIKPGFSGLEFWISLSIIDNNFDFELTDYPIFDESYRATLNQNILNVPILTELKIRVENLEDRDFYKIIESYDNLPNPGLEKIIYLVPNNGSFLEYL